MNPVVKNILAVVAGLLIGGAVNMAIVTAGFALVPFPEGLDMMDPEVMKANMDKLSLGHYLVPFAAHAIGTLVGALVAAKIAANRKMVFALLIGAVFLAGGITEVILREPPMWFTALDLLGAYLPMAYFGGKLGGA